MTNSESIIGKRILVGLTYLDSDENVKRRDAFHGPVVAVSESSIVIERSDDGQDFSIPNDTLYSSDPDDIYTLESGEEVTGVYATCTWTIFPPDETE